MRQSREGDRGNRGTGKARVSTAQCTCSHGPGPAVLLWRASEKNRSGGSRDRGEQALPLRPSVPQPRPATGYPLPAALVPPAPRRPVRARR